MMMKAHFFKRAIMGAAVCIFYGGYAGAVYATQAEFKMIRSLEKQEKKRSAELILQRPTFSYLSGGERDPFESLITKDEAGGIVRISETVEIPPPVMTVQGVIWGGQFPQAIVNEQLVKIGDKTTEGVIITRIDAAGISFEFNEKEYSVPSPAVRDFSESE